MSKIMINNILFVIFIFTIVAVVCCGLYYITDPANAPSRVCDGFDKAQEEYFEGTVVKKYKSEFGRHFPIFDIEQHGFIYSKFIYYALDSALYKKISVGDYIIKKRGQTSYSVKFKNNQKDTVFLYKGKCNRQTKKD